MGIKISALPAASGADSAMQFEVNNAGTSQRLTLAQMFALEMGAVTVDTPLFNLAQTWNAGAVTFTGWKLNVTDTASAAASKLLDLQTGGVTRAKVDKAGRVYAAGFGGGLLGGFAAIGGELAFFVSENTLIARNNSTGWVFPSSIALSNNAPSTPDLYLYRDAANALAQRNATSAQEFRLYNTFTDASNYERGFLRWNTNVFEIGTQAAGTGSNRELYLVGNANIRLYSTGGASVIVRNSTNSASLLEVSASAVNVSRHLLFPTDNTYDLGASAASRPRTGYFATSLAVAGNQVVAGRATGWGVPTGTPTRTTFATGSVTLSELAERVKALLDDLTTHGLIGA